MKRFFLMTLLAAVFFTGLGGMISETTAKFKSDEKALALIAKARQAIGGDNNIAAVNSLVVTGKATRFFKHDGVEGSHQGDMELALQFPDKMMKMIKMGHGEGMEGEKSVHKQVDVTIVRNGEGNAEWKSEDGKIFNVEGGHRVIVKTDAEAGEVKAGGEQRIIVKKIDGEKGEKGEIVTGDDKHFTFTAKGAGTPGQFHGQTSGLVRTALSLLLTAPQGTEVSYLYAGEGNVDGTACSIVDAQFGGGSVKLYLSKSSNLPVMISYQDAKPMVMFFKKDGGEAPPVEKNAQVFERHAGAPQMAEFQVKFSDYRNTNGVQLPYKWVQTVGGQPDETIDVSGYEINSANIGDKFKPNGETKVLVRKAKESSNQ